MRGGGILIDDRGRSWSDSSSAVARSLGRRAAAGDLCAHAVRQGFIHIRAHNGGMQVSLGAGLYSVSTLAAALYAVHEQAPPRILLAVLSGAEWQYSLCATVADLAAQAEGIARDGESPAAVPWFAVERDLRSLAGPRFDAVRPLMKLWFDARGALPADLVPAMARLGMAGRTILVRQSRGSSRLVCEHFGAGIRMLKPCDTFLALGRDVEDVPDRAYGEWVAEGYRGAVRARHIQLASVRATIRTWEAPSARVHYDRLLIPWRDRGDMVLLSVSLRRAFSRTV
jgi:hypothetical protein